MRLRGCRSLAAAALPLLPILPLLFTSCLSYRPVELMEVSHIRVVRMDAKGIAIRVDAKVKNPNNYRIHAQDPDVDLFVNDKFVGKGLLDSVLTLEKQSEQVYSVPLHADLKGGTMLMVLLSGVFGGNELQVAAKGTIVGRVGILRKRFPFAFTEKVEL